MRITDVRCVRREGTLATDDAAGFYASRVARPLDAYREFRDDTDMGGTVGGMFPAVEGDSLAVSNLFLEVETSDGLVGMAGPIEDAVAVLALGMADLLEGRDPLATERLWDLMYRAEDHGRKGKTMMAISAVDCALWDLRGRHYGEPVYRLLGGPTRTELPAYASMFLYSTDPADVRETAAEIVEQGYGAQKWFFQHGPGSGQEGRQANLALAAAAREGAGPEQDLMFDAWTSWGYDYTAGMLDALAEYDPYWLEEPVAPDQMGRYADLREQAPFRIVGGEHEYTRWGFHELFERGAVDVAQPDTFWAGGISELDKIFTLASAHDVPVIPHGTPVPANLQVSAAQPPTTCPMAEYLPKLNRVLQFFFEEPISPEDGVIAVPDRPGLGVRIDDSKVETEREFEMP